MEIAWKQCILRFTAYVWQALGVATYDILKLCDFNWILRSLQIFKLAKMLRSRYSSKNVCLVGLGEVWIFSFSLILVLVHFYTSLVYGGWNSLYECFPLDKDTIYTLHPRSSPRLLLLFSQRVSSTSPLRAFPLFSFTFVSSTRPLSFLIHSYQIWMCLRVFITIHLHSHNSNAN